jgi:hypothetical protein
MNPRTEHALAITRRQFFGRASVGIGTAALASLLGDDLPAATTESDLGALPGLPHFAPKAKRVISRAARRRTSTCSTTSRSS